MGLFNREKKIKASVKEVEWINSLLDEYGTTTSSSGIQISRDTALKVAAVYSCVKVISNQIAQLPMGVYRTTEKGRIKDKDHPVYRLLHTEFNEYTIPFYGIRPAIINLLLTGYGYIMINRKDGMPNELWPIDTKRVTKEVNQKGKPRYKVDFGKEGYIYVSYTDMIELQGISTDGVVPYNPVKIFADAIGLSRAAEKYSSDFFKNGITPSGVVEVAGAMGERAYKRLKKSINDAHGGLGSKHKVMLLEDGAKFNRISAPPEEAQTIEARKFQVIEVARFFNVPPSKIMDYERATWGNMEEVNRQFVNDCLMEYIIPIEQLFTKQLLMDSEKQDGYYIKINLSGLLRGKQSERYTSYAQARQWGWLNANEIREMEEMSNIGPQGDIYLTPTNMADSLSINKETNQGEQK